MISLSKPMNPIMKRTTPVKDRHTMGYVYGGTIQQRVMEADRLKHEYKCFMTLTSSLKNEKFIEHVRNGQSGNGMIVSLHGSGTFEFVR